MLSETACKANAFGMTYLGEKALWGWLYARMTKYWIAQMKQYLELILGIQSIVSLAVLALQRFMMVTRDRQVAFLCRYIGCAEKTHPSCCCDQRPCMCLCSLSWLVRQFFKHKPCQHHGFAVPSFNWLFHSAHPCLHLDLQVEVSLVSMRGPLK